MIYDQLHHFPAFYGLINSTRTKEQKLCPFIHNGPPTAAVVVVVNALTMAQLQDEPSCCCCGCCVASPRSVSTPWHYWTQSLVEPPWGLTPHAILSTKAVTKDAIVVTDTHVPIVILFQVVKTLLGAVTVSKNARFSEPSTQLSAIPQPSKCIKQPANSR
jgi:hypothetical protein